MNSYSKQLATSQNDGSLAAINEGLMKKIQELENELVKEKAVVHVVTAEKENLENQLKISLLSQSQTSNLPGQQMSLQIQKSLEDKNDQISTLLEQINKLKLDSIHVDQEQMAQQRAIQELKSTNRDLEQRVTMLATENERLNYMLKDHQLKSSNSAKLQQDVDQYLLKNMDLEQKLTLLAMENERLQFRLKDKDQQQSGQDAEFRAQIESMKSSYEQQLQTFERRVNALISENEKLMQFNQSLQQSSDLKAKQLLEQSQL